MDPDTFITAVYVLVDDLCRDEMGGQEHTRRRGRRPQLSLSEAATLALLAQMHPHGSERAFIRYASEHWKGYFPTLSQSRFNRCVRKLGGQVSRLAVRAGRELGESGYEAADGTVVPLMRRCRGQRRRLFSREEAWIGRGGSDRGWVYGIRLFATAASDGGVRGFSAAPASTEERWLAEELFRRRHAPGADSASPDELAAVLGPSHHGARKGPGGPPWPHEGAGEGQAPLYIADRGLKGRAWKRHWQEDYGARVITGPEDGGSAFTMAELRSMRQVVETVFHILKDHLGMGSIRARTPSGLKVRVAAKIAALNVALLINRAFGLRPFAIYNPIA